MTTDELNADRKAVADGDMPLSRVFDLIEEIERLRTANGLLVEACEKVMADAVGGSGETMSITAGTAIAVRDALVAAKESAK